MHHLHIPLHHRTLLRSNLDTLFIGRKDGLSAPSASSNVLPFVLRESSAEELVL